MVPNRALCYGIGFVLAFFAFVYVGTRFVLWSTRAASWHLVLSILLVITYFGCSIVFDRLELGPSLKATLQALAAVVLSPVLFAILQISFGIDALRRFPLLTGHR